ncbi:hypothetical protein B0H14DRAFT_3146902 [Mycena olivaceomarginata]|nr:hypothetical protein B0H14DRAFT_3146902 [Mycena olivaceomarginata]
MLNASEVQITGGNFLNVAGDVNLHNTICQDGFPLDALGFVSTQYPSHQLAGVERIGWQGRDVRMLPYDVSQRPRNPGGSNSSSFYDDEPSFTAPSHVPYSSLSPPSLSSPNRVPSSKSSEYPSREFERAGGKPRHPPPADFAHELMNQPNFPLDWLPDEPKTNISGVTFIGGNVNNIQRQGEYGLHILHNATASDAFHDSAARYPQPKCHPETRTDMLDDLYNWSSETDSKSSVLWLHGPAGAGKSAIAQSLCHKLETEGSFGGSFFFKRGDSSRGNGNKLFPTIAYQISLCVPEVKRAICQVVEDDPSITNRSLSVQLQRLIIEPCRQALYGRTLTVIIDGLDECEGQDIQQEILSSIGRSLDEPQLPLRFLVASRPEPHIRETLIAALNGIHRPVNINQSFEDVEKYLLAEFARIHRERRDTMSTVPFPWPSPEIIDNLVKKSSGYFIYASTVIKFIDDKHFRPTKRLEVIVGIKEPDCGSPFAALDQLYTQILSEVRDQPRLLKILVIIAARLSLSVDQIEQLVKWELGDGQLLLRGVHSVIGGLLEEEEDYATRHLPIFVHHASFLDFLQDPARAGIFYGGGQHRTDLALDILKAMSYKYDEPTLNHIGHVAWWLHRSAFECITSSEPFSAHVSLLHSFNPIFVFRRTFDRDEFIDLALNWLKRSRPLPEDLIRLWEDYRFMSSCEFIWQKSGTRGGWLTKKDRSRYQRVLSASPSLIRVLQAIECCREITLFEIHILLDFSWDELRMVICSLCSLMGNERKDIEKVLLVALEVFPARDSISWDLACGSMRALWQILEGELDFNVGWQLSGWSRYLGSCPPSRDLLQDLQDIEPALRRGFLVYERSQIVQWLKTFPEPPQQLISRIEGYDIRVADSRRLV